MIPIALAVLALSLGGLAATYVAYPLVAVLIGNLRARRMRPAPATPRPEGGGATPSVTFVICAYNEAEAIEEKLQNTLALDYPEDALDVLVASDCSDDGTDEIVRAYPDARVQLVRNPERGGKTRTTVLAIEAARGEILVFSDATGMFNPEALRGLTAPFVDPRVGAASGRVVYDYGESATARGFRLYQRWVVAQRRAEPGLHTLTSVSGSIHAVRRSAFEAVPGHLSYDMAVPALMAMQGLRCVYAHGATSLEVSRQTASAEFGARTRIAMRAYSHLGWLWSQRRRLRDPGFLIQLFLHKVLRWFSVHLLLTTLAAHLIVGLGAGGIALALLIPHVALYGLAGWLAYAEERARWPGAAALLLFATVNAAYAVGFWRWLRGGRSTFWNPDRSAEQTAGNPES